MLKEIDLGKRKISRMNFSYVVTIPKTFVRTSYGDIRTVKIVLLEDGCLKLVPIHEQNEPAEFTIM